MNVVSKKDQRNEQAEIAKKTSEELDAQADAILEKGEVTADAEDQAEIVKLRRQLAEANQKLAWWQKEGEAEKRVARRQEARAIQGQAAHVRAMAQRDQDIDASADGTAFFKAVMALVDTVKPAEDFRFMRRWLLNGLIMSTNSLVEMKDRQLRDLRDQWQESKRAQIGGEIDANELAEIENEAALATAEKELAMDMVVKLKRAFFKETDQRWMPRPRQRGFSPRDNGRERSDSGYYYEEGRLPQRQANRAPF